MTQRLSSGDIRALAREGELMLRDYERAAQHICHECEHELGGHELKDDWSVPCTIMGCRCEEFQGRSTYSPEDEAHDAAVDREDMDKEFTNEGAD